ncbi:hypothetical protein TWF788_002202 [Orbilia oligospora]|uniref:Uncharacterized protein n=1 Tax=Orbilia oligospora TaxID=2813651 RepID=A0A6G1M7S3_ORBOL|nr:hypothetical protein TWF788_002202 [Orbilia oligospora]KAF3202014.1 hypothetical protein TWF679_011140 [Orbilia oligospora]KAF3247695.1 hypothetical protein TWF192_006551 [Orbilia oligospora]
MADGGPGFEGVPMQGPDPYGNQNNAEGSYKPMAPYGAANYTRPRPTTAGHISRWLQFIIKHRRGRDNLAHINRILSTTSGTDKLLMLAGYTLMALTAALERVNGPLPAGVDLLKATTTFPLPAFPAIRSLEVRLRALSGIISDFRIFSRLWGLFGIAEWAVQVYEAPPKDQQLRQIAYAQVCVNIIYQSLENVAYLSQHKILRYSNATQNKLWAWSCRFWAAHVALDFCRLWRIRMLRHNYKGVTDAEDHEWWRQISSNLCWAPLTIHWSVENGGLLDGFTTGALGTAAGILSVQHVWRQTRT